MAKKTNGKPVEKAAILTAVPGWADADAIGELVGRSGRTIQSLARRGVLETEAPPGWKAKKYPTCKTIQRYIAHVKQEAEEKAGCASDLEELGLKKLRAEVELKESQGELHRLKTAIAAGKYVDTENAGRELAEFLRSFRQFALDMPARAVRSIPGQVDVVTAKAMERAMRTEMEAMLNTFADAVLELGKGAKAG
ncbi:MAG: hypothetical protein HFF89_07110 [Oscillibacter sp.]|jgi:phage terminase Nu1 subunit (DNA packaging protein)|nr:hypothetical protein [Oscillibacter sp.]MCI8689184.1 hypothetical protein [Oscillibacter sp.]MCI9480985.1 hypothetical protein [Oscillibacter sp.]